MFEGCEAKSAVRSGCEAKSAVRSGKYERSMLIQAAAFAVKLIGKKAEIPVNNFINCYIIFNNVVLLTVNLIFSNDFVTSSSISLENYYLN
ncbi:unnamed protein product [Wuchereria bancrofti]|uniref:Uncharacterized protein n=1 Tax=Wuchereria bancrofti TaxID=6293 RepID=A0A3P7EF43_WUCBA|nr:unnamed protein product [Wuchereria bancrofti]